MEIKSNDFDESDLKLSDLISYQAEEPEPGALGKANISEEIEYSHLVETESPFWDVFPISSQGVSAENWHTLLVQNHLKFDYTITPISSRNWHLTRKNKAISVQFRSELFDEKDILARKKRGKFACFEGKGAKASACCF